MPDGKQIKLTPAKGRPMLTWVGKKPLQRVTAFPAQLVEKYAPAPETPGEGLIFHGDNKDVLAWLLANGYRGKVDLVYIDPPFDSGADYVRKVELRGVKLAQLEGEDYSLGEQILYADIWTNDNYLQFMYERFLLLKDLLANNGWIIVHVDHRRNSYIRVILDEVFGVENFRNEIIWHYSGWNRNLPSSLNKRHDTLIVYAKSDQSVINPISIPWKSKDEYVKARKQKLLLDQDGKEYVLSDAGNGKRVKRLIEEAILEGRPVDDVWDLDKLNNSAKESVGFETQKPEDLLKRIISAYCSPNKLVLDCFAGSGTTAAVAQKLGRRWIIADINKGAVQTASKRLQRIISEQIETTKKQQAQPALVESETDESPRPAQLGFSIYRVNDYDLQIQHNEALNLAIEHIGIERLKGDPFFDGTLGKQLAKVIPFNHPLTRLDLQLIQDEINTRSGEERDIVVACLGKEITVDGWLAEYNHKHPVNKIKVIELRTDPKYGKFFEHHPASAEVQVKREGDKIRVEIVDFISPTILERLEMDAGLFAAKITDWRAMVDTVLIDVAYDGEVFNVALSDVPERKADLVLGKYELPAPAGEATVAVKIIDMLGEEALVVEKI